MTGEPVSAIFFNTGLGAAVVRMPFAGLKWMLELPQRQTSAMP